MDLMIGRKLRQLRLERALSQRTLAEAVGISFQQLQKYESGKNRVSASMLFGLARRLAVPFDAFFEGFPEVAAGDPAYQDNPVVTPPAPPATDQVP